MLYCPTDKLICDYFKYQQNNRQAAIDLRLLCTANVQVQVFPIRYMPEVVIANQACMASAVGTKDYLSILMRYLDKLKNETKLLVILNSTCRRFRIVGLSLRQQSSEDLQLHVPVSYYTLTFIINIMSGYFRHSTNHMCIMESSTFRLL